MNIRRNIFHRRINLLAIIIAVGQFVLLLRFGYLQILESGRYRAAADGHSIMLFPLHAPRGDIVDRNGTILAASRPSFRVSLLPHQLPADENERKSVITNLNEALGLEAGWLERRLDEAGETPLTPIRLAGGISARLVSQLEERRLELPGLLIEEEPLRYYPYGSLAAHTLGYIGEISLPELQELWGSHSPGDLVGKMGIEQAAEKYLKGTNGGVEIETDARGNQIRLRGRRPAYPGKRVVLTLDLRLQERCEELLGNRRGTIIAMEAKTGEILALASNPKFDPNWFASGRIVPWRWYEIANDRHGRLQNRATQALYSPGSIFKIVTASAGLETGILAEDKTFECAGTLWLKTWPYKCWNEIGHGWLNLDQAIINSCDIYFYKAGLELKVDLLAKYAEMFGFGELTGIDLPAEKAGHVPTRAWKEKLFHLPWFPGNTVQLSIGQGYLLATPMQMVRLLNFVALDGRAVRPHVIKRVEDSEGRVAMEVMPQISKRIPIAPSTLTLVKRGLRGCVNYYSGTGHRCHIEGLSVSGKTSTVQNPHGEDHAAFGAFVPSEDPELVVVTFIEHGLSGGVIGALISRSVIKTWDAIRRGVKDELPREDFMSGETGG